MPSFVDLRSDTVTKPTAGMRRAIADAEVGDDVYGDDPSVNELQDRAAALFGKEAAMFVPSGTMANGIWMRLLQVPGTETILEWDAHVVTYENGSAALLSGNQFRTVPGRRGLLTPEMVEAAVRIPGYHMTPSSLVSMEQTHNKGGGTVYPLEQMRAVADVARRYDLKVHVDGARIFNAAVATATPVADFAALADGTSFCVSKGLGAPVGTVMVGERAAIDEARVWRRRMGGAMRQAGVLAAAGVYALEHHVERLADDHANAAMIAGILADAAPEAVDLEQVQTNIVFVDTGDRDSAELAKALREEDGVAVGLAGPAALRLVTHLDVDADACKRGAEALARRLAA